MTTSHTPQTPTVEPSEAREFLESGALLIDVRSDKEWQSGHLPLGVHIPLERISRESAVTTRTRRVIVVSRSGRRATEAVKHLRTAGIAAVALKGGLHAWLATGGEIVADNGKEPRIA